MAEQKKMLVLQIEVPGLWADDLDELAAYLSDPGPPSDDDRLYVVTEEWIRDDVVVVVTTLPGEKCLNDDFSIESFRGRIVGAEARDR